MPAIHTLSTGTHSQHQTITGGTMTSDSRKWFALAIICVAQFMVILDVSIVNVALPSISAGAALLRDEPALGLECVRPHVWWFPHAWRPRGGQARTTKGVHNGRRHLHCRLPVLWIGDIVRLVGRVPGRSGSGGCDPVSRRPVDPDSDLRGRSGAEHRLEHLGGDRRGRRRVRSPAGRHSHPGVRLAMDLLRQRPDRLGRRTGELLHPHALSR